MPRFIDHETMSMQSTVSLGRVGRVLGGEIKLASRPGSKENISRATTPTPEVKTPSSVETPVTPVPVVVNCQEPDVVASAKASIQTDMPTVVNVESEEAETQRPLFEPVAPPRRKRNKAKAPTPPPPPPVTVVPISQAPTSYSDPTVPTPFTTPMTVSAAMPVSISAPSLSSPVVPIPTVVEPSKKAIHSFTKGFDFSLDLMSATKGNYVIKPQVILSTLILLFKNYQYLNDFIRMKKVREPKGEAH